MALVGNLKDLKLPNLIQINCMEKNVAKLLIENRNKYGSIYFADGQIVHAEYDDKVGEEAIYAMLRIKEGFFKVEADISAPAVTIQNNWSNILLEGMRLMDEDTDDEGKIAENTIDDFIAVRGVEEALIISPSGEISAASPDFNTELLANFNYSFYKLKKVESTLGDGKTVGLVLNIDKKYFLSQLGKHFLVLQLENKTQIDILMPSIRQIIIQKSNAL